VESLLIAGDFNFHLDNAANSDTARFIDILDSSDLTQHVTGSTHRKGHTLDLIISQSNGNLVSDVKILNDAYSDHRVVLCKLNCPRPPLSKVSVYFRSTKQLKSGVLTDYNNLLTASDPNTIVDVYNSTLRSIYDNLAPLKTRWINHRPWAPWYDENLRDAKRNKRMKERKYKKSKLTVDKEIFIEACEQYNSLLERTKTTYYKNKIQEANQKELFRLVDSLFKANKNILPRHESQDTLANEFNNFFINKIRCIMKDIEELNPIGPDDESNNLQTSQLSEFHLRDDNTIKDLIVSMSSETCSLDTTPTEVVKKHIELLTPVIGSIARSSLSNGTFLSQLKTCHVKPKLKKNDLDKNQLSNYRPVSNILFLVK